MATTTPTTPLDTLIRDLATYAKDHLSVQASLKGADHTATLSLARPLPYAEQDALTRYLLGYPAAVEVSNDDTETSWSITLGGKVG